MKELSYPFNTDFIISNTSQIIRNLRKNKDLIPKRIAIVGSTNIKKIASFLEVFLLNYGIDPSFLVVDEDEYNIKNVINNPKLKAFDPDVFYICSTNKDILKYPDNSEGSKEVLKLEFASYKSLWDSISNKFNCLVIQNNFELPFYRLMGNYDVTALNGKVNYINKLNSMFAKEALDSKNFFICDLNYISAFYGLDKWFNNREWHLYKHAMDINAMPLLAFNAANIIKSYYGLNPKAIIMDLDDTIWGGKIADVGVDKIKIGFDNPISNAFSEFQSYLKGLKELGTVLNISSKNEYNNSLMGLKHPSSVLKEDDFTIIKSNFDKKDVSVSRIFSELDMKPKDFVFLDDNPHERNLISENFPDVSVPDLSSYDEFLKNLDKNGYFERTHNKKEDLSRFEEAKMRSKMMASYSDYNDYLEYLTQVAEIKTLVPTYYDDVLKLYSSRFNLTKKKYPINILENITINDEYIKLYGKIADIFGDMGIVAFLIGHIKSNSIHIESFVMANKVVFTGMEYAMMDELVLKAKNMGITTIFGYFALSEDNKSFDDVYNKLGFKLLDEEDGVKTYLLNIEKYEFKNKNISVEYRDEN